MKKVLLGFFLFFALPSSAQFIPTLDFFYGAECPHCHDEMKWFDQTLVLLYPDIKINKYEMWCSKHKNKKGFM